MLLANRRFSPALLAMIFAGSGRWIAAVTIPLWVLARTGSVFSMSMSLVIEMLPAALIGPFLGLLLDRFNRKPLLLWAMVGRAACTVGMVATRSIFGLYVLVFAEATLAILASLAISSLIPDLVGRERITEANAAHRSVLSAMRLVGPAAAAALLAVFGYEVALLVAAALLLLAVIPYALLRPAATQAGTALSGRRPRRNVRKALRHLASGLTYSLGSRPLRVLLVVNAIYSLALGGVMVLFPLIATQVLGDSAQYGTMMSALGAGLLVGSAVLAAPLLRHADKPASFAVLTIVFGLLCGPLALATHPLAVLAVVLLMGLGEGVAGVAYEVIRQEETPAELRGRVFASQDAAVALLFPVGAAVVGALIGPNGARLTTAIMASGVTMLIAGTVGLFLARPAQDRHLGVR